MRGKVGGEGFQGALFMLNIYGNAIFGTCTCTVGDRRVLVRGG